MTCNYSAKNSSLIYNTYHNFVRFAIIQNRIPFPQFVLDCPFLRSVFLDNKKPSTSFLVEGSRCTRSGVRYYLCCCTLFSTYQTCSAPVASSRVLSVAFGAFSRPARCSISTPKFSAMLHTISVFVTGNCPLFDL